MAFWQMSGGASSNGDHYAHRSIDIEAGHGSSLRSMDAGSSASTSSSRPQMKSSRAIRKNSAKIGQQCSLVFFIGILSVVLITFLASQYVVFVGFPGEPGSRDDYFDHSDDVSGHVLPRLNLPFRIHGQQSKQPTKHELKFGQGFRGRDGERDSRDWDTDDRDRTHVDESDLEKSFDEEYASVQQAIQDNATVVTGKENVTDRSTTDGTQSKGPGLAYERGRKELKIYEEQYEAELNATAGVLEDEDDYDDDDGNDGDDDEENLSIGRLAQEEKGTEDEPEVKSGKHRKPRHKGPCEIKFNTSANFREPENASKFAKFELNYVTTERPLDGDSEWTPAFAGHQTMDEREASFVAANQTMHCGFVQGSDPLESTGFDLSQRDRDYLATCRVAVSSCIFGKSDQLHTPRRKTLSSSSRKEACMVMFVDQETLDVMVQENQAPDEDGYVGLWRVVLVKNLPFNDLRLVGKIPKFLSHRLFPSAKYSIWLDSKLRLQSDPLSILEYFLWRGNREYSISNHYDRHCVWDEVLQNKKLNKFNHTLIDEQFRFYQSDGLVKFNASDPARLLPSYVPEGSLIIRAHTPMSNLFSCLWFNEVVRFTPRDQLSFAYTYLKLVRSNPSKHFRFHMFKDCERKRITKLFRHRQIVV